MVRAPFRICERSDRRLTGRVADASPGPRFARSITITRGPAIPNNVPSIIPRPTAGDTMPTPVRADTAPRTGVRDITGGKICVWHAIGPRGTAFAGVREGGVVHSRSKAAARWIPGGGR